MTQALFNPALARPLNRRLCVWFAVVHASAIGAILYLIFVRFDWPIVIMAITIFTLYHLGTTAGTHRLWAHEAYKATLFLRIFLMACASGTFQSSVLWWCGKHRDHHAFSDTSRDPYTVLHGFPWAHFGWILHSTKDVPPSARSLMKDKVVVFQHQHYLLLAMIFGLGVPALLGALIVEPWWMGMIGGFLVGGPLRIALQYHLTWIINSVAHTVGTRRYPGQGTARTNVWLAIPTVGESFHERHHLAQEDPVLGNRWYDLDIGKWYLWFWWFLFQAHSFKRVSEEEVFRRAREVEARAKKMALSAS